MHSEELKRKLVDGLKQLGIERIDEPDKFFLFIDEILKWNKKFNLTTITSPKDIIEKHFLDSLLIVKAVEFSDQKVIDVGSGAGFPGIPLKIVFPDLKLTLLDSSSKRVNFLKNVKEKLDLKNLDIICGRAEDVAKNLREEFDLSVSRAVARLSVLSEYCLPFVRVGGKFLALKSENIEEEVEESKTAIDILGGQIEKILKINIPGTDILRSIVVVEKIKSTPFKFPRKAGIPKKRPITRYPKI